MPRKTASKARGKRAKPKMPEGDEGKDLDMEMRKQKVQAILEDFDVQISVKIDYLGQLTAGLLKSIDTVVETEMLSIPKELLDMKLEDFKDNGGKGVESGNLLEDMQSDLDKFLSTESKDTEKRGPLGTIQESTKGKRGKKQKKTTAAPPPTQSKRNMHKMLETPRYDNNAAPGYDHLATPMITPKFDPRLIMTPAYASMARSKKAGEVAMSLQGSPLVNQRPALYIPTRQGQEMVVTDESVTGQCHMDAEAIRVIQRMQAHLSNIVATHTSNLNSQEVD